MCIGAVRLVCSHTGYVSIVGGHQFLGSANDIVVVIFACRINQAEMLHKKAVVGGIGHGQQVAGVFGVVVEQVDAQVVGVERLGKSVRGDACGKERFKGVVGGFDALDKPL